MANQKHSNRLTEASSPYLLQHAHNPVDWFPWGEEALEKAKRFEKEWEIEKVYTQLTLNHLN